MTNGIDWATVAEGTAVGRRMTRSEERVANRILSQRGLYIQHLNTGGRRVQRHVDHLAEFDDILRG